MPWGRYFAQARRIGASIGVRALECKFWEELDLSCFVEKEEFSGNMRKE
jgi:hypothetical protein